MKKIWILLVIVLVVLFLGFREGLEPTQLIKAPPYSDAEADRAIALIPADIKDAHSRVVFASEPSATQQRRTEVTRRAAKTALGLFYNLKYKQATAPITNADVDGYVGRGQSSSASPLIAYSRALLKAYFVDQASPPPARTTQTGRPLPPPPGTRVPPKKADTMNDNVWGPRTTGLGTPRNFGSGGDGDGQYPTLLGPPRKTSGYMTGVGVLGDKPGADLPSSASMGSDPLSGFLPFSRQPGDQELIADPYRVAQSYSASSYSSKNEPVPFLTDFSAFQ